MKFKVKRRKQDTIKLFELDYSQVELRVAADLSDDPVMMDCFLTRKDIHSLTASRVLGVPADEITKKQRQSAKPINFGTIFDMSAKGLQESAEKEYGIILSDVEAAMWRAGFFRLYRGFRNWMIRETMLATKRGCSYVLWDGEPYATRWLPDLGSSNGRKQGHAKRQALNTPIQGGASLYTLKALIALYRLWYAGKLPGVVSIMHTIHDSIILAIYESFAQDVLQRAGRVMVSFPTVRVPLEVEGKMGDTLGDMVEIGTVNSMDLVI